MFIEFEIKHLIHLANNHGFSGLSAEKITVKKQIPFTIKLGLIEFHQIPRKSSKDSLKVGTWTFQPYSSWIVFANAVDDLGSP